PACSRIPVTLTDPRPGTALSIWATLVLAMTRSSFALSNTLATSDSPDLIDAIISERTLRASAALASASARCSAVNVGRANLVILPLLGTRRGQRARVHSGNQWPTPPGPLPAGSSKRHQPPARATDTQSAPISDPPGPRVQ